MPIYQETGALTQTLVVPFYGAIRYEEITPGSPVYTLSHGGSRAERTFLVSWDQRQPFVLGVLGYPKIVNTNNSAPWDTYVARQLPQAMEDLLDPTGGNPFLFATGVTRMEGVGPRGGYVDNHTDAVVAQYDWAKVTVCYEALTYNILPDDEVHSGFAKLPDEGPGSGLPRYVTKQRKPSVEFLALPRGLMKWADTNQTAVDFATASLVSSTEVTYTWHQVPFLPDALKTHVGTLNLTGFNDGDFIYNPGTLLLVAVDLKPYRHASGQFVHDITYRMKYFEPSVGRGHNYFLRYDRGTNRLVRRKLTHTGNNDELPVPVYTANTGDTNPDYTRALADQTRYVAPPLNTVPVSWAAGAAPSQIAPPPSPQAATDSSGNPIAGVSLYDYTEFAWLFTFHNPGADTPVGPVVFVSQVQHA